METIDDILKEMRELASSHTSEDGMDCTDALEQIPIDEYADRIESAHAELLRKIEQLEQENAELKEYIDANDINGDAAVAALTKIKELVDEKMAEIAKLKAALKMTTTAMCNYCRSTPEAKGLPCLNGCHTLSVAKAALGSDHESGAKCSCADCGFKGMELCEHRKAADEIARLKAALKPVLECEDKWSGSWEFASHAADAVEEAHLIYNEGKDKEE